MSVTSKQEKQLTIAVVGATGHTGRFVVAELLRRGITPIAVGRNAEALKAADFSGREVERRVASVDDAASLDRALRGAGAVINCAGPFLDTADAVASAAMRARIHYLDVTAEQASARATLEKFDAAAREAGVAVVPAMGFYGGFADLLVTAVMGGSDRVQAIDSANTIKIMIGLDSWHPTRGTRETGAKNTGTRFVVSNGQLVPVQSPPNEKGWKFADPIGHQFVKEVALSEIVLISRHVKTIELHNYISANALRDIHDEATPAPKAADDSGRSAQQFIVEVVVQRAGETRSITARGRDIYAFSAPLVCEAAERLLRGKFREAGAHAPGEIFDAREFLSALPLERDTPQYS
jgi:short subunit dehydrogenase-like uncharacterized protein